MFNNDILTAKFFYILDDGRNLSYKKYDEEKKEASFTLPHDIPKELVISGFTKAEFDRFYKLGNAIKSGDILRVSETLNTWFKSPGDVTFVCRCFTRALHEGGGKAMLAAEGISRFVNAADSNGIKETARLMARDHRTLQQAKMRLFVAFCEEMSTAQTDLRNKGAVELAKAVLDLIEERELYLPFI